MSHIKSSVRIGVIYMHMICVNLSVIWVQRDVFTKYLRDATNRSNSALSYLIMGERGCMRHRKIQIATYCGWLSI